MPRSQGRVLASASATSDDRLPLSSFVGRASDIEAVGDLLDRHDVRLVTITGPGGAGKSRLAGRVMEMVAAARMRADFVALASIRQPGLILPAIGSALGVPEQPEQPANAGVRHALGQAPSLLVLDNLEHVLDEAATVIHDLMHACPELTVLGTSRVRLGLSGEHVYPLSGLEPDEARSLFIARAQATRHDFAATPADIAVVDTICERVDRLPLAIELAAARTNVLTLPALRDRLERRLEVLTGGPRDAPGRQRTMRATIAWSYGLLTEREQRLYGRLGVFVGGFTLDAVRAITADGEATLDEIAALVAASLVIPMASHSGEPRYTMLETIREYAFEQLVHEREEDATHSALLQHLIDIAERLWAAPTGLEAEIWMARVIRDLANIRATLDWAVDHDPVEAVRLTSALYDLWMYHAGAAEGRQWVDRALASASDLPPPLRARGLWASGGLACNLGDLTRAVGELGESFDLAHAIDDTRLMSYSAGILAEAHRERGDLDLARAAQEVECRTAEALGEPLALAIATLNRGKAALAECDLPRAQALFEEAVSAHRQSGSLLGVAIAQYFLSDTMLINGDIAGAADQAGQVIRGFARTAAWVQVSGTLIRLSAMAANAVPETSVKLLAAAQSILDSAGITPLPDEADIFERTTTQARSALGETAFDLAWKSGCHLDLDEVFEVVDEAVLALAQPIASPTHGLSPRETEVLRLVAAGRSNRAIATDLSISERTVENHVFHILAKLDLDSRTAAATWAVRNNLD